MPSACYEDAVRYVRCQSRISTNSLADGLGIRWSLALGYLEEMKRRGIVGDIQEDGWWPVLRKEAFSTPRKLSGATASKSVTSTQSAPAPPEVSEGRAATTLNSAAAQDKVQRLLMEKLQDTIRALAIEREKNHKLSNNCRLAVAEREAWKHRALAAEARIVTEEDNEASEKRLEELSRSLTDAAQPDAKKSAPPKPVINRIFPQLVRLQGE